MARWTYGLTELDGTPIGPIDFAGGDTRKLSLRFNAVPSSANFAIRLDNPMAKEITDRKGDCLLKVYQEGYTPPRFIGDCATLEEAGPGYKRTITRDRLVNLAYALPGGTTSDTRIAYDTASILARGMFEEVIPSSVDDSGLRQALIEEAIKIRSTPQERIEFVTPTSGPGTLACNFMGPLWRLGHRFATQIPTGGISYDPSSVTFPSTQRQLILKALLDNANAVRDTGIRGGTYNTLYPSTAGEWTFTPMSEAYGEMATAAAFFFEVQNIGTSLAYDDFTGSFDPLGGPPPSGTPGGRAAPRGGTWIEVGSSSGTFHTYGGGPAVVRQSTGDTGGAASLGRFAFLSSGPYTDQFAQVDISYLGSFGQRMGVLARFIDTSPGNWARAVLALGAQGKIVVEKCVGGTVTELANSANVNLTVDTAYSLRLQINAAGDWAVWLWTTGGNQPAAPWLRGQDSDLATGGPLASGKVGIYDLNASGTPSDRVYDSFLAQTVTQSMDPQGLDFELVATEPTADSLGVQIATLNVAAQLGTVRPDVIFDFSPGASNPWVYGVDYGLGDTVGARRAVGTTAADVRFDGTTRVLGVDISRDKEGKQIETPVLVAE